MPNRNTTHRMLDAIKEHIATEDYINAIVMTRELAVYIEQLFKHLYGKEPTV